MENLCKWRHIDRKSDTHEKPSERLSQVLAVGWEESHAG